MSRRPRRRNVERYDLSRSPLAQKPTQKMLAQLVGLKRDQLRSFASSKEDYIVRRTITKGTKDRHLAYPTRGLRRIHERLKYHFDKIILPEYIFSPRTKRSQRDNAALHRSQKQFLTLDIKQFYPSTSREVVLRWALHELKMFPDVAGLFCEIVTVDNAVSMGSPLTPVLTVLVHKRMFDDIASECARRGLRFSVWVDDIVISGNYIPGDLIVYVRQAISRSGMKSHKLQVREGARPVFITGIPVHGRNLLAPKSLNLRIKEQFENLSKSTPSSMHGIIDRLLSAIGSFRHIVGKASPSGRLSAARMDSLRRRRAKVPLAVTSYPTEPLPQSLDNEEPF